MKIYWRYRVKSGTFNINAMFYIFSCLLWKKNIKFQFPSMTKVTYSDPPNHWIPKKENCSRFQIDYLLPRTLKLSWKPPVILNFFRKPEFFFLHPKRLDCPLEKQTNDREGNYEEIFSKLFQKSEINSYKQVSCEIVLQIVWDTHQLISGDLDTEPRPQNWRPKMLTLSNILTASSRLSLWSSSCPRVSYANSFLSSSCRFSEKLYHKSREKYIFKNVDKQERGTGWEK